MAPKALPVVRLPRFIQREGESYFKIYVYVRGTNESKWLDRYPLISPDSHVNPSWDGTVFLPVGAVEVPGANWWEAYKRMDRSRKYGNPWGKLALLNLFGVNDSWQLQVK